ncbi:hypothetical protein FE257_004674 [Aspergillus nanangensis]|uniref:EKC/KEOPS complex subunit GON7 n=1 Tax=Aspergillus nanangensis TaxID=2582783 RepID=A0AAD4GZK0_ASPNN|nr:hypothetical protein FE257_004674 [Aspergillus nanangensis]
MASQFPSIRAVYNSPDQQQPSSSTFEHHITAAPPSSSDPSPENVQAKVAYLKELRKLTPVLQNDINVFLTERMEDDKKAAEAQGKKLSEKEAKEEENYGEEVMEEDA